jgi:Spy/CpxP family protein refolding chaperone
MRHIHKHLIAAVLASLALAAGAQTAPPAAPATDKPAMREHRGMHDPARMQEHFARRQAALKQKLQITPAQEGAWNAYLAAMKPPANFSRPAPGEFERLTTPERIDRMRSMHTARAAEMDKRADATKTFYAALSPEQKKVFDTETLPRHFARRHGGMFHRG